MVVVVVVLRVSVVVVPTDQWSCWCLVVVVVVELHFASLTMPLPTQCRRPTTSCLFLRARSVAHAPRCSRPAPRRVDPIGNKCTA